jgi:formate-dependent nitrite reductase membrane component NrfD
MDRMFRVLGFWAFVIALMFLAGHMYIPCALFLVQTVIFFVLGYMKLTERTYMYLFGAYMLVSFTGMAGYATFWG